jgi:hypothetical protein
MERVSNSDLAAGMAPTSGWPFQALGVGGGGQGGATEAGVTGWPAGDAEAPAAIFRGWLEEHGGTGSREDRDVAPWLRWLIGTHGQSRFETVKGSAPADRARAAPQDAFLAT